jgi:hypothetical protein
MTTKEKELEWLHCHTEVYHNATGADTGRVEDLGEEGKMGQGFSSVDRLEEVDLGDGAVHQPTFINAGLTKE